MIELAPLAIDEPVVMVEPLLMLELLLVILDDDLIADKLLYSKLDCLSLCVKSIIILT